MRALFDANVLLDVLLRREPLVVDSTKVWDLVSIGEIEGLIAASTLPTIGYVLERQHSIRQVLPALERLTRAFHIANVGAHEIASALDLIRSERFSDFEDAVQHAAAEAAGADSIITRNERDFAGARLAILTPRQVLDRL
jgi:predicted nucleic acid-binding protein